VLLCPIRPFLAVGSRWRALWIWVFQFYDRNQRKKKPILEFNFGSAGLRAQYNFYTDSYAGR
jgi:hypothetical protein